MKETIGILALSIYLAIAMCIALTHQKPQMMEWGFTFNCGAKMKEAENDRDCEHCAHYVKAGLDWFCCESWECEFKPKGDEKND